jgi:hypothetical protein
MQWQIKVNTWELRVFPQSSLNPLRAQRTLLSGAERATPPPPLQPGASATGRPQGRVRRGLGSRSRFPRALPAEICRPSAGSLRATGRASERASARDSPQPSLQDPRVVAAVSGCLQDRGRRGLGCRSRISRILPVDG